MATRTRRKAPGARSSADRARQRQLNPKEWMSAMVVKGEKQSAFHVQALQGDESFRPADSPILWMVDLTISHAARCKAMYLKPLPGEQLADPSQPASLTIQIGHARGSEAEPRSYMIECELGHLDALAEALTTALRTARSEGALPIARGIRPWTARSEG